MIFDTALQEFDALVANAPTHPSSPVSDLASLLVDPNGTMHSDEFAGLWHYLSMAHHAGEMGDKAFRVASVLRDSIRQIRRPLRNFDDIRAWHDAIASVELRPDYGGPEGRAEMVGLACKRLKSRGAKLKIGPYGPEWEPNSLAKFCDQVDVAARRMGGQEIIDRLGHFQSTKSRVYRTVWMLGETELGVGDVKTSAAPTGWLLGLAAKYSYKKTNCRLLEEDWSSLIEQSTDIAASLDCQKYDQFDGVFVSPFGVVRAFQDMMRWRGLFFTPQIPLASLDHIQRAFEAELTRDDPAEFASTIRALWREFTNLALGLHETKCSLLTRNEAKVRYPYLLRQSAGHKGKINARYVRPIGAPARNDTSKVFLAGPGNYVLIRPSAMTIHAFCETVFTLVWTELDGSRARDFVGNVMEVAVASACKDKAESVHHGLEYFIGKKRYEIDVAARTGNAITLIETKAKSLTAEGQSGAALKFFSDYAQSFGKMLEQLTRHEFYIREGLTSIQKPPADVPIEKIIVSPTSYGPIGDRMLTGAIHKALSAAKLSPTGTADADTRANLKAFEKAITKSHDWLYKAAPRNKKDELDLTRYFMRLYWLDLGQVVFAIENADSIDAALKPIRHLSYASRDFWTEYGLATKLMALR